MGSYWFYLLVKIGKHYKIVECYSLNGEWFYSPLKGNYYKDWFTIFKHLILQKRYFGYILDVEFFQEMLEERRLYVNNSSI